MPLWSTGVWADTGGVSDGRKLWASGLQSNQHYTRRVELLSSCTAFARTKMHVIDVRDPGKLQGSYLYEVDNAINDVVIEQSTHTLLMYHSNKY